MDMATEIRNVKNPHETWTLNETLTGVGIVAIIYLTVVTKILPAFMKNRPPYKLKNTLAVYNALQVFYSVGLVFSHTNYIFNHGVITTRCPKGEDMEMVIRSMFPYFLAKHIDLLDTVFFVLRKKDNQVTFLHLYHHTAMVTWVWLHYLYHPTDHFAVVGMLNSFVHVVMYTYYGIASLGPEYARFIWWKKHLTKVQLVQFILVLSNLHYQQKWSPCPIPAFFHNFCILLICSFFVLFIHFYVKSYKSKKKQADLRHAAEALKEELKVN